eukprot:g2229.t1
MLERAKKRAMRKEEKRRKKELLLIPEVRARHILVKHENSRTPFSRRTLLPVTRTKEEAHEILESLLEQLDDLADERGDACVEEEFIRLAKEYSDCDTFSNGGDVGAFRRSEKFQKQFEDEVYDVLEVGELSTIVDTESGSHLIFRTK